MQSIETKYMLPGMKPRSRPNISPKQGLPGQLIANDEEDNDEDTGLMDSKLVKRSSVRNLDLLRAGPEMLQLLQSRGGSYLKVSEPQDNLAEAAYSNSAASDSKKDPSCVHQSSTQSSPRNINDHAIRLIQFIPEWSILLFIRFLKVEVVAIENSPFPNALGKSLPVVIHGNAVISGRNAILEYLNQFNHFTSFNFYYSPMACYIDTNCYQNLQHFNHLTHHSRLQSSVIMPWGLKYAYSWVLEWWNQHQHFTHPLLTGYQEQEILRRLDSTYQYLSGLILPNTHHAHLQDASSLNTPSSDDDGLQLADVLLYGHMAEALLTSHESIANLLRKYPLLVEAFNIDSDQFFSNSESVSDAYHSQYYLTF